MEVLTPKKKLAQNGREIEQPLMWEEVVGSERHQNGMYCSRSFESLQKGPHWLYVGPSWIGQDPRAGT